MSPAPLAPQENKAERAPETREQGPFNGRFDKNAPLKPHFASSETLALLHSRRSTKAKDMTGPGPSRADLEEMLGLASRVPDHGKLAPWRFVVLEGEARSRIGDTIARAFAAAEPSAEAERVDFERNRLMRAPCVVAVVSRVRIGHKIPEWEQLLSAGAVCQTLLIAASAKGFAAQWLTEWYSYDPEVLAALGLAPFERLAGFVYLGTATCPPLERDRPALEALTTYL